MELQKAYTRVKCSVEGCEKSMVQKGSSKMQQSFYTVQIIKHMGRWVVG